ncbi:metallopeptidase TldD-related protein [Acuticoccus sp. M5D2P5]|uniref:metallopeptidase TldD-related protein n=1 Tax=Acuticoccus kalidii TaxID=2910977 RepID=UPI001F2E6EF7|nr:metallopeptidase TldD-related protein [Acuticoccus kalidii]MCF3933510.1 metallopeptidase TldD-related protein [Acuticoccus kalidii]
MSEDLFERHGLDAARAGGIVDDALNGSDDGELFVEHRTSESLVFDDGRLKSAAFDVSDGFGLRAVAGEAVAVAHASDVSEGALRRAADAVSIVGRGREGNVDVAPQGTNRRLYGDIDPIAAPAFADKAALLATMDAYARAKDPRVRQVSISLNAERQIVNILRAGGQRLDDIRPLVRFTVSVMVADGDRRETGSYGAGGREPYARFIADGTWQAAVDEALRRALVNLDAAPAPAGTFDVVLGPGWPGILLHEAVGHGLEGDFNRRKTSAFAGLMGERVASPGVTVVDDGTHPDRRGSLSIDDEGTPSHETVLIEDGRLVGYMQDRQNARLMGMVPTGNGRRQSYAHTIMPRMTNTIMRGGNADPEEIRAGVKDGLYMVSFGGGQVDITSGKFVFSSTEAYRLRDGKICEPVRGAMLIGNGPDALTRITAVGNDMALDHGIGTCGKQGQWVPVGVGQPTIRINAMTVGGTET